LGFVHQKIGRRKIPILTVPGCERDVDFSLCDARYRSASE